MNRRLDIRRAFIFTAPTVRAGRFHVSLIKSMDMLYGAQTRQEDEP